MTCPEEDCRGCERLDRELEKYIAALTSLRREVQEPRDVESDPRYLRMKEEIARLFRLALIDDHVSSVDIFRIFGKPRLRDES